MNRPFLARSVAAVLLLLLAAVLACSGCSRAKRAASRAADATKSAATKTGQAVGEHVGNFFAGVGEGVETSICDYAVEIADPALAEAGLGVNLVRRVSESPTNSALSLYVLNKAPVSGTLRLRLLAADGREIGRSETAVSCPADAAGYLHFSIPSDMPTELVRSVSLTLLP